MLGATMHAEHTACEHDGIPYAACKAVPCLAAKVLVNTMQDLETNTPATGLASLNGQLAWFAPRGVAEEDQAAVGRSPNNLRSSCDAKLISGSIAFDLVYVTMLVTSSIQRGFCCGR